jgi:hypothetical protein
MRGNMKGLLFLLLIASTAFCTPQSANLAFSAFNAFESGQYLNAWGQYSRALLAAKKEANTSVEVTILLNMAQIQVHSEEWDLVDSLLSHIHYPLNSDQKIIYEQIRGRMAEQKNQCANWINSPVFPTENQSLNGLYFVCQAQTKPQALAHEKLNQYSHSFSKKAGYPHFIQGKVHFLTHNYELAQKELSEALNRAQKAEKYFVCATTLELLAKNAEALKQNKEAGEYYKRSAEVFERLGLQKPFKRNALKALEFNPQIESLRKGLESL